MNSIMYEEIIEQHLLPFMAVHHPNGVLHQDNDSKHSSLRCRNALKRLNINWVI